MPSIDITHRPPRRLGHKLARLGRFLVFLCTAGWAFPHVCTEDMDLTSIQNEHMRDNA